MLLLWSVVCTLGLAGGVLQLQFGAGLGTSGAVLALLLASAAEEAVGTAAGTVGEDQVAVSGCGDATLTGPVAVAAAAAAGRCAARPPWWRPRQAWSSTGNFFFLSLY